MLHQCPECGSTDTKEYLEKDIKMLCCNNCQFCWADYKNGELKKPDVTEINPEPPHTTDPEND